jgi:PadR family transcriptional regulator PadR
MAPAPRMTMATQLVLRAFLADPAEELYGSEIGDAAGLMSGTVHPILARLEAAGWVESHWEDVDPQVAGRPARRYYRMTGEGAQRARSELARVPRPHPGRLAPHPEPGLP